jgi:hypothetical protein
VVREQFGWARVAASFAELCERAVRLKKPEKLEAQVEKELRSVV